jgi:hypothetical protein
MRIAKIAAVVFTLAFFGATIAPRVRAQDDQGYIKRTRVTFSQQIEIPGQYLPAGTYMMELIDSNPNRHIVRFSNADRTKVIATVLAIPNLRLKTTDKTVIMFAERPANSPEALKAWFFPGDNFGQEFVYPKTRAIQLAQAAKEPVLAFTAETEPATEELKTAPVVAETPAKEEEQVAEVVEAPAPVLVAENRAPEAQEAPKTASPIPLIALIGVTALGLAFAVKRFTATDS